MPTKALGFLCHLARMNEAPSWLSEEELKAWEEAVALNPKSAVRLQLEEAEREWQR